MKKSILLVFILFIASILFVACHSGNNGNTNNTNNIDNTINTNKKTIDNIFSLFKSKEKEDEIVDDDIVNENVIDGALFKGKFSIAKGKQVYFSQGNLQYQASTKTWRFAKHQYDVIPPKENFHTSPNYEGWIDVFAWGTSGWMSGAREYQPYSCSNSRKNCTVQSDYYPGGDKKNNLTGKYAMADWGIYNSISNGGGKPGIWRTLSQKEWAYLIEKRPNAARLFTIGTVEGIKGLILLPDNWKFNEEYTVKIPPCTHLSKYENASKYTNYEFYTDDYTRCASYDLNVFTSAEWAEVEAKGAVFFPIAEVDWPVCTPSGSRAKKKYRTMKKSETLEGSYWTSTSSDESVRCLEFNETEISIPVRFRECRRPVRLAQDCNKIKH